MERANLDPKHWSMQRAPSLPTKSKREAKELVSFIEELLTLFLMFGSGLTVDEICLVTFGNMQDDSKSKKGLAEVYEEEYVQKSNPLYAPATFSDELKKEASMLFKKLCLKLDALSHFHFTPKPVIEEMSIQTNVPAIAMEEVAPVAVSDAAMLAPEEIFSGTGKI
ncbi:hypothetical protein Bca52824_072182 [Brassica carinata]|uniref:Uncharacterized protein n=1 Tax=Brassica carinata TaxID=52824 RepID=A0A8X7NYD4_BRACI|nr:hypothetical protein Bca52824_096392 [Brassica carinata]KAG2265103.1 hypothetical protein Bca52824_072182 [Brassica carinata]